MTSPCTRASVASRPERTSATRCPSWGRRAGGGGDRRGGGRGGAARGGRATGDGRTTPRRRRRRRRRHPRRPSAGARSGDGPRRGRRGRAGRPGRRAGGSTTASRSAWSASPRGGEGRGHPGRVVGGGEPTAQGGGAVADLGGRHPEQVGHLVGPGSPDRLGTDEGPFEGRRRAHDRLQRGQHGVVVLGLRPGVRWTGRHPGRTSRRPGRDRREPRRQQVAGAPSEPPPPLRPAPIVARVAPGRPSSRASRQLLVERGGEGVGGDPARRGGIERDDEGDALEVGPAGGHELSEVVLDGECHPSQSHTGRRGANRLVQGQRRVSAVLRRRPRRPRGCPRWPGRTRR